uniref:recQ-mediated genome instability protein 2-like n=1 Tax=Myxine glutinosa TaxID=7769 RepID=UPI00358EE408
MRGMQHSRPPPPPPPLKVLARQLQASQGVTHARLPPMLGSSVWLQADVITVKDGGDEAILSDGSATFRAVQLRSAPGADRAAVKGKYVLVYGILQSHSPDPVVKAIKMMSLSDNPFHKHMWKDEVLELQQYML